MRRPRGAFLPRSGPSDEQGTITRAGLQPDLYTAERTSDNRHEAATFDWETGVVLLNDNKTAALETPTLDPLAVLWQFYFAPPDRTRCNSTSRPRAACITQFPPRRDREGRPELRRGRGAGLGARERRRKHQRKVWLAPSLHNVMVKLRLSNDRGTVEALLDSIRVDETVAQR
jgi:hypothetical protein